LSSGRPNERTSLIGFRSGTATTPFMAGAGRRPSRGTSRKPPGSGSSTPAEPVFALVAEDSGRLVGLTHYLYHRSTTRVELTCYLQDLFTEPAQRGRGIGRALIEGVYEQARGAGIRRVYWQTQESNAAGRLLYDKLAGYAGFIVYSAEV